jgi:hypothetical protein
MGATLGSAANRVSHDFSQVILAAGSGGLDKLDPAIISGQTWVVGGFR